MTDLNSLVIFARVAEIGSFSGAAQKLGMPVSTVSRRIADLEDQLGTRLLERSTRALRLTELGAEILTHAERSAEISETVAAIVTQQKTALRGTLRLSVPPNLTDSLLAPLVTSFQAMHPEVHIKCLVTDRDIDLIADGVDIAFRVGRLTDSSLVSRPLLTYRHQLVASPTYLKKRPSLVQPEDLLEHPLLAFSFWKPKREWTFVRGDNEKQIEFVPHLEMNDYAGLAKALIDGLGIGELPPIMARNYVKEGLLKEVMPQWSFRPVNLSLLHLGNRHIAKTVLLFKEHALKTVPKQFPDLPK